MPRRREQNFASLHRPQGKIPQQFCFQRKLYTCFLYCFCSDLFLGHYRDLVCTECPNELSVSCLLQTPTLMFFTTCVPVDGTDGEEISVLICIQNPGVADAAFCKRHLNAAVNMSVRTSVCLLLQAAKCTLLYFSCVWASLMNTWHAVKHYKSIWTDANTMAYIIQWLTYYKNRLLHNSVGHVACRAYLTLCYSAVVLTNATQRGQTLW